MNETINLFQITKVIAVRNFPSFVSALNTKTIDAYIAEQTHITRNLWLLRVACSERDDAKLIRGL